MYLLAGWLGNRAAFAARTVPGDFPQKLSSFANVFLEAVTVKFLPTFHLYDFLGGLLAAGGLWYFLYNSKHKKKKFRTGKEHGSAAFGTQKDIEPFTDYENPDNNIPLTQSEHLTMGVGKGAQDRNKNVMCFGAPGTGKTLFVVEPCVMQMLPKTSIVVTDPKGLLL
jgi:type IV secretion system protein VirD4